MDLKKAAEFLDDYNGNKFHDAEWAAWRYATESTGQYINDHMHTVRMFSTPNTTPRADHGGRNALMEFAVSQAKLDGLFLELGVHEGKSVNFISRLIPHGRQIHGFDSFEGLPGDWLFGRTAGHFSLQGNLPKVEQNVILHKGWFNQTLPPFLKSHPEPISFIHIDSDIYSSAREIFQFARDRFVPGTILVFDEYFNYPGWQKNEFRAFQEFVEANEIKYEYIGCAPRHCSVAVKILSNQAQNPESIANQIFETCAGKTLNIGFGKSVVKNLAANGTSVWEINGAQVIPAADAKNLSSDAAPVLTIPAGDESFETIIGSDFLENVSEADLPKLLAELQRVTKRFLFVRVSTTGLRENNFFNNRDRAWWEKTFFAAGFRKNPLTQAATPFEALEKESWQITLALEKIPAIAAKSDLGIADDPLRQTSRNSDAQIARYELARRYLPENGLVVDFGCGTGFGSAILAAKNPNIRVVGWDSSAEKINYARQNFSPNLPNVEFSENGGDLSSFGDNSVDLLVAVNTLHCLPKPENFFAEVARILKPGGAFIGAVPNEIPNGASSENGNVFGKFLELCQKNLALEILHQQTAGIDTKFSKAGRQINRVNLPVTNGFGEWTILSASKRVERLSLIQKKECGTVAVLAPDANHPIYSSWLPHCPLPVKVFSNVPADFEFPADTAILVTHDTYFEPGRSIIRKAVEKQIPTLILADGILEYRNTFEHPQLPPGAIFQPVLGHKIACFGASQARTIEGWGNSGKTEIVGSPRFDRYAAFKKRERSAKDPFKILVVTALTPYFTESQHAAVRNSLKDLKNFFDANKCFEGVEVQPIWRLTKNLSEEIGLASKTEGKDLAALLQEVDAVISTPSTCLLEAMLLGLPTAALDYTNVPHYVQTAWRITAQTYIAPALAEMLAPPAAKMLFQEESLHHELECHSPATPRLLELIEKMISTGMEARKQNARLEFPANLLSAKNYRQTRTENRFEFSKLFPLEESNSGTAAQLASELQRIRSLANDASNRALQTQIFHDVAGQFSEEKSLNLRFVGGKWRRLTFSGVVGRIRFDPADGPALLNIAGVCVRSEKDKRILWFAKNQKAFDAFIVGGHARRLPHEKLLSVFSFSVDPQIILPDFGLKNPEEPLQITIWIKAENSMETVARLLAV